MTRIKDLSPYKSDDEIGISEILILYFLVFIFLIGSLFWAKVLFDANAAENWPSVDGIVISSLVGERIDLEGDVVYTAVVTYQYSVNGLSYVSHRIAPGSETYGSSRSAKVKADQYPEGMIVKVYYDPDSPDKALLEP
ncbi:DUF3592 domain-containing protein [bacterium]|nr:DUF3592 domain-containing protein [bacterium]